MLGGRLISWSCIKQTFFACSTTEAKYVIIGRCCAQILWILNQLLYYDLNFAKSPICYANTSVILITQNLVQHSKTKHRNQTPLHQRHCLKKENISFSIFLLIIIWLISSQSHLMNKGSSSSFEKWD